MSSLIALALLVAAPDMPEGRIATVIMPAEKDGRENDHASRWPIDELEGDGEGRDGLRVRLRGTRVKLKLPLG